jgi:dTDP-4-amino-4,6-dideoxygalactose transaminase
MAVTRSLVPFARPAALPLSRIDRYYRLSEESGWYTRGPCNRLLAERASALGGAGWRAVPLSSGTTALMVALRALAAPPEQRRLVVVPSFTCAAVPGAVVWAGYEPVFVDVDREHWHLAVPAVEAAVSRYGSDIAAMVAVTNFGTDPHDDVVGGWTTAAASIGAPLILDAAAGLGAVRPAGDATIFSFEATKPAGSGEGGLLLVCSSEAEDSARRLAGYGLDRGIALVPGLNGKLSELSAAALLCRLDELDSLVAARQALGAELVQRTQGCVAFQAGWERSAWQSTQTLFPDETARAAATARADELAVEWKTLWEPPLHRQTAFEACSAEDLTVTEDLAGRSMSLPMTSDLSREELDRVLAVITGNAG